MIVLFCMFFNLLFHDVFLLFDDFSNYSQYDFQKPLLTGVTSFEAYIGDVIGRRFENRSEVQMSMTYKSDMY